MYMMHSTQTTHRLRQEITNTPKKLRKPVRWWRLILVMPQLAFLHRNAPRRQHRTRALDLNYCQLQQNKEKVRQVIMYDTTYMVWLVCDGDDGVSRMWFARRPQDIGLKKSIMSTRDFAWRKGDSPLGECASCYRPPSRSIGILYNAEYGTILSNGTLCTVYGYVGFR